MQRGPMTAKFESAIRHILATKNAWCEDSIQILSCIPQENAYAINVYLPVLDRHEQQTYNYTILLTEVLMHLN